MLAQQLGEQATRKALGHKLTDSQLGELRNDQIGQLFELFQEIQSPSSAAVEEDGTKSDSQGTAAEGGTKPPLVNTANGSPSVTSRNDEADSTMSNKAGSWW